MTLLTLLLVLTAGAALVACASTPEAGLVNGVLRPCPGTPNCVNSEGPQASIAPLSFGGDPDRAFASLVDFLVAEPRVELVEREADYAHFVARTRTIFRDDLELRLDREARVVHVRSASRLGYSDLGVNRRRVESIRERWQASETR